MKARYETFLSLLFFLSCVGTDFITEPDESAQDRIEITPLSTAVLQNSSGQFSAVYYDVFGNIIPEAEFDWSVSEPDIALIDSNGEFQANNAGQTYVTASSNGITSPEALLTVVTDVSSVARVVIMPESVAIQVGEAVTLSASAFNLNDEEIPNEPVTWLSSDTKVATVSSSGLLQAFVPGTTEVTASVNGIKSLSMPVMVESENRTGTFSRRQGTSYDVSGSCILRKTEDGNLILEFGDDFSSSSGPGLAVYLSKASFINSESLNIGSLKFTSGQQTYAIPSGVGIDDFDWVIIHCVPFNVTFGQANLQ